MKLLKTYNESIKDKMSPRELTSDAKIFYKSAEDMEKLGFEIEYLKSDDDHYEFLIINDDDPSTKYITISYLINTSIDYYDKDILDWKVEIYYNDIKNGPEFSAESWEELLPKILNELYPDIDKNIKKNNNYLEKFEKISTKLNKIKKFKND